MMKKENHRALQFVGQRAFWEKPLDGGEDGRRSFEESGQGVCSRHVKRRRSNFNMNKPLRKACVLSSFAFIMWGNRRESQNGRWNQFQGEDYDWVHQHGHGSRGRES
ncbi:hypothetical protein JAAARDRAFT_34734 [Jaapia argillacea MUCL 33604]|uniref:Uncharacterized protein n=1 Tax=Jaapia argillacea MUCL 33604 TaxID=933084 RepID=A0A067PVQ8_9AGAM|nr:hypothetical protein JAAARDRAFT_34734 [Jaapia argillacea MUCL 33604]